MAGFKRSLLYNIKISDRQCETATWDLSDVSGALRVNPCPCLHRSDGHWKHNEKYRQQPCAQLNCSKTRGSAQRLVLLKTGLNDTHPNQEFLGQKNNQISLRAGGRVWLTDCYSTFLAHKKVGSDLVKLWLCEWDFSHFFFAPKVKNCSFH